MTTVVTMLKEEQKNSLKKSIDATTLCYNVTMLNIRFIQIRHRFTLNWPSIWWTTAPWDQWGRWNVWGITGRRSLLVPPSDEWRTSSMCSPGSPQCTCESPESRSIKKKWLLWCTEYLHIYNWSSCCKSILN